MSASPNEAVKLELSTHCSAVQPTVTRRKEPKRVSFLPKRLFLKRPQVFNVSVGLENMWNTCYMNSVLQCLTHTPPLTNYMLTKNHSKTCLQQQSCTMCTMEEHITEVLSSSGKAVWPFGVLNDLTNIGKHFRHGMQKDAYEFLHCLIGAMQQDCIVTQMNGQFEENTIIDRVFVGHLRSSVMCLTCYAVTDTIEPFVDISLEIEAVYNIYDALASFMMLKMLDRQTALRCKNCQNKTEATKTLSIHHSPNVLTVHLKRFSVLTGQKIEKAPMYVGYPEHLDLRSFMSADDGMGQFYKLYAVLVHSGSSLQDGHHFCFVKTSHGKWLKIDDSSVTVTNIRTVLSQQAYVLFYIRSDDPRTAQGSHKSQMPAGPVDVHDYATVCQYVGTTGHRPPPAVTETLPMNYSSAASVAPPPANRRGSEQNLTKNCRQNSASTWPRHLATRQIYSDRHHYRWDQSSFRDRSPHDRLPSHRELHHCQRQTPSQPQDCDHDRSSHHYDRDPRTIEISWHERSGSSHHHQRDSHDRRMESRGSQKRERSPETHEDCRSVKRLKTMSDRHP